MNRKATGLLLTAALFAAPAAWSQGEDDASNPQKIIQKDQERIQEAQRNYQKAVMQHGAASNEAKEAMDRIDAAKNQLQVDQIRAKQLQETAPAAGATGGSTGAESGTVQPSTPTPGATAP